VKALGHLHQAPGEDQVPFGPWQMLHDGLVQLEFRERDPLELLEGRETLSGSPAARRRRRA